MQNFLLPEGVETAISRLQASGFEAYLVGGCVRDMLMGNVPSDYDLTSSAKPEELCRVFRDYRVIKTGITHGTVTVLLDELPLEITTFRIEGDYSDGRRPDAVHFCLNLYEDLARRDFTINAMAYHPVVGLIDPYEGQKDLQAGCIRCVGRADKRFEEDALRILRALRFASTLGFFLETETEVALRLRARGLLRIAAERIRVELDRLLCGKDAPRIVMDYMDVLGFVLPELANLRDQEAYLSNLARALTHTPQEAVLRWSVLLHAIGELECLTPQDWEGGHSRTSALSSGKMADALLHRLRFDRKSRERIVRLIEAQDVFRFQDETSLRSSISQYGADMFFQLLQVNRAIHLAQSSNLTASLMQYDEIETRAKRLLAEAPCLSLKNLAVKGQDIMDLGFEGPEVGQKLNWLLQIVINGEEKNEKEILLTILREKMNVL